MIGKRVDRLTPRIRATLRGTLALAAVAWLAAAAVGGDPALARKQASVPPESIRAAVNRALPLLVKASSVEYPRHRDCFSCHNQAVPALALSLARQHGFAVEAQTLARSPSTRRRT